ncbi:unnamed protein product, partial [Polarella glacialis]
AFWSLVRTAQGEILPRYGFESSDRGLQELVGSLEPLAQEPDIQLVSDSIGNLLFNAPCEEEVSGHGKLHSEARREVLSLLRAQLAAFGRMEVSQQVEQLKLSAGLSPEESCDEKLPGLAELALSVQTGLLPTFGFEANRRGLSRMICSCAQFLGFA